jgi:cellular nucleic acid-binding protein
VGHFSKECPKPRDYSRVTCNTCGEKGHTSTRCKAEKPETIDAEDGGFNDASVVPASNDAPTGEVGDWNVQEESAAAW